SWVMRIDDDAGAPTDPASSQPDTSGAGPGAAASDGAGVAEAKPPDEGDEPREKVIVRSDGTVTYVGKDMAYQMWKFGLLGLDFHYRRFTEQADGRALWST